MTREILNKYIESIGMKLYKGDPNTSQAFMPFMCMDAAYQIFSKAFNNPSSFRFLEKKWIREISKKFKIFFIEFNKIFTVDELVTIGEDQDLFYEYVLPEIEAMKSLFQEEYSCLEESKRTAISEMHTVNILAACAAVFWEQTFHTRHLYKGDRNREIDAVMGYSKNFARVCLPFDFDVTEELMEKINDSKYKFTVKVSSFIKEHQTFK